MYAKATNYSGLAGPGGKKSLPSRAKVNLSFDSSSKTLNIQVVGELEVFLGGTNRYLDRSLSWTKNPALLFAIPKEINSTGKKG